MGSPVWTPVWETTYYWTAQDSLVMVKLTEDMIVGRTRVSDLGSIRKLNCWGADLTDIAVIRLLQQVEVLSLSVNNIQSLEDIRHCLNLKELFVRKNDINSLSEILWLRPLKRLSNLMLSENPCSEGNSRYRHTVLRTLPQLKKLDNQDVTPEEMAQAMRLGIDLEQGEEEEMVTQHQQGQRESEEREYSSNQEYIHQRQEPQHTNYHRPVQYEPPHTTYEPQSLNRNYSSPPLSCMEPEDRYRNTPSMDYRECAPSVDSRRYSRQDSEPEYIPQTTHSNYQSSYSIASSLQYAREAERRTSMESERRDSLQYHRENERRDSRDSWAASSRAMLHSRPKNRNSNMLSAILCLIKEIDGPSLEVVEMAARCRMEELED